MLETLGSDRWKAIAPAGSTPIPDAWREGLRERAAGIVTLLLRLQEEGRLRVLGAIDRLNDLLPDRRPTAPERLSLPPAELEPLFAVLLVIAQERGLRKDAALRRIATNPLSRLSAPFRELVSRWRRRAAPARR